MAELNRNEKQTIGTNAVVVSKTKEINRPRKSIIITNTSTGGQVVTVAIDEEAKDKEGIVLYAGGLWSDTAEGGYTPTQALITAISNNPDATISIQERLG